MARTAVLGTCALLATQSAASAPQLQLLDSISGEGFLLIQQALPQLASRGLSPQGYKITVWRTRRSIAVMFESPKGNRKANVWARIPLDSPMEIELPLPPRMRPQAWPQ